MLIEAVIYLKLYDLKT